ncbi:MAG: tetratricopeptide repeat protein [Chitinophagales bacterium]
MSYLRFKLPDEIFEKLKDRLLEEIGCDEYEGVERSKIELCIKIAPLLKRYYEDHKKQLAKEVTKVTISKTSVYRAFFSFGSNKHSGCILYLADWVCRYLTNDLEMTFLQYQGLSKPIELSQYLTLSYEKAIIREGVDIYMQKYPEEQEEEGKDEPNKKNSGLPKFITSIHSPPEKFVGREIEIAALQKRLENESLPLLVSGMGGMGKTSIVAKWFVEHLDEYDHIMWIDCRTSLPQAFINNLEGKELPSDWKLKEKESPNDYTKRILHKMLNIENNNLLIIDGWDNETEINQYRQELNLPNWTTLITTRVRLSDLPCFLVGKLDTRTASQLFTKHAPKAKNDFALPKLLEYIDYHTLTIELLAKTFENTFYIENVEQLLKLIQENKWEDEDLKIDIKVRHSEEYVQVYSHLLATFHLSELNEFQKWLLLQFSVLPSISINGKELGVWLKVEKTDRKKYVTNLNVLTKKGWIEKHNSNNYQIHPIIQSIVHYQILPTSQNCTNLIESFSDFLAPETEKNPMGKYKYIRNSIFLLANLKWKGEIIANLCKNLACTLHDCYEWDLALEYQLKATNIYESFLKKQHPILASCYNILSMIYHDSGDLQSALIYQEKAIEIRKKIFKSPNSELASSYGNISLIHLDLENLDKSLHFQLKAFEMFESILKPNHPKLAVVYNNLANIYHHLSDFPKALDFQKKSINIIEKEFEPNHPHLAGVYNSLSLIYSSIGKLNEALIYQEKALKIRERIFKPIHPQLALSYNNISSVYLDLGDFPLALHYQKKSLRIKEEIYSADNHNLATSYNNLSIIYNHLGKLNEALAYELKAIKIREAIFGLDHSYTAFSYVNLSDIYYKLGNNNEASEYINKAVFILKRNYPEGHYRIEKALNLQIKITKN